MNTSRRLPRGNALCDRCVFCAPDVHIKCEEEIARFMGTEAAILCVLPVARTLLAWRAWCCRRGTLRQPQRVRCVCAVPPTGIPTMPRRWVV